MTYTDSPEYRDWEHRVRTELIPKLEDSSMTVSLVPEGETDIKFAVELGLSIMLDKPIIAVVHPGAKMPERLVRVADHIVEADLETETGRQRVHATLTRMMAELDPDET